MLVHFTALVCNVMVVIEKSTKKIYLIVLEWVGVGFWGGGRGELTSFYIPRLRDEWTDMEGDT